MQTKEDYRYEICGKNGEIIDNGYVCLETAIEYALEHNGYTINMLWFPCDEFGDVDCSADVIAADTVWERLQSQ
jgi:hypothetical protein